MSNNNKETKKEGRKSKRTKKSMLSSGLEDIGIDCQSVKRVKPEPGKSIYQELGIPAPKFSDSAKVLSKCLEAIPKKHPEFDKIQKVPEKIHMVDIAQIIKRITRRILTIK